MAQQFSVEDEGQSSGPRPGEMETVILNQHLAQQRQQDHAVAAAASDRISTLNEARAALMQQSGGGSIEINGQKYDDNGNVIDPNHPPELGPNAQVAQDTLADLDRIAPLVRQGLLGADDVRAVVKSSAMGDIADQRNSRKAQRAVEAIMNQTNNGTFTEQQTSTAIESLKKNYHEDFLAQVPGYAKLVGKEDEIAASRVEKTNAFAKQQGIDPSLLQWDADSDRPVLDSHTAAIQTFKINQQKFADEQANLVVESKRKNAEAAMLGIGAQMKAVSAVMTAQHRTGGTIDPALTNVMFNLAKENSSISQQLRGGADQSATTPQAAPAAPKNITQASNLRPYGSTADMITALKTGTHKVGEPALINGVPWVCGPDGVLRRVK